MTRIALIHALEESVLPIRSAFSDLWPEAYAFDLLDTSLAVDRAARGELDEAMMRRFKTLGDYACEHTGFGGRTQGILFTCSAFGPAIAAVKARLPVPVLKPNEAAFDEALRMPANGTLRLGLIVTFGPSLASLKAELQEMADAYGRDISIHAELAEGALPALKAGDGATHDRLAAEAVSRLGEVDVIVLGQFSLARARSAVEALNVAPVITTPHSAVRAMRKLIGA